MTCRGQGTPSWRLFWIRAIQTAKYLNFCWQCLRLSSCFEYNAKLWNRRQPREKINGSLLKMLLCHLCLLMRPYWNEQWINGLKLWQQMAPGRNQCFLQRPIECRRNERISWIKVGHQFAGNIRRFTCPAGNLRTAISSSKSLNSFLFLRAYPRQLGFLFASFAAAFERQTAIVNVVFVALWGLAFPSH